MATIQIYGDIGESWWFDEESLTGKSIASQLASIPQGEQIDLRINSVGGDVSEAVAIYHLLKDRKVTTYIDGYALSAASIVALAGQKIVSPPASIWMLHNPSTMAFGDSREMLKTAAVLDTHKSAIVSIYCDRTGKSVEEINQVLDAETWLTGDEAIEFGLADLAEAGVAVKNTIVQQAITNNPPPQWFRISAKGKDKIKQIAQSKGGRVANSAQENKKPEAEKQEMTIENKDSDTTDLRLTVNNLRSEISNKDQVISDQNQKIEALTKEKAAIEHQANVSNQWHQLRASAESLTQSPNLKIPSHEFEALFAGDRESPETLAKSPECAQHLFYLKEALATAARRPSGLPTNFVVDEPIIDRPSVEEDPNVEAARSAIADAWKR
jgi:ATP-dependent protease ClpP protease subunit